MIGIYGGSDWVSMHRAAVGAGHLFCCGCNRSTLLRTRAILYLEPMSAKIIPLLACLLGSCATAQTAQPQVTATPQTEAKTEVMDSVVTATAPVQSREQRFADWKSDFTARAVLKGYSPELLARTVGRAKINERAIERNDNQPEFTRPVWAYIESAASADRITRGRSELSDHADVFAEVEGRYSVPRHILTAIWGLETSYGRIMGDFDIVDSLSTFAFEGRRQRFGEQQLFAVLDLISSGEVREDQLRGAWAGAMGMTQFIPTTFRDYAVDFDGDGNKDLWTSERDALGSAANYLSRSGWRAGEPVMAEVLVPDDFDYGQLETVSKTINDWTALGVRPANGMRWGGNAGLLSAKLLAPAGSKGPKLLVFKNFDVLKRYNNSTSYVMGIASLGDALRGRSAIRTPWPKDDKPLSLEDKKRLQARLTELGYSTGGVDGQIGPNSRKAIRAWQRDNGVVADGYVEQTLLARILG